MNLYRYAGNNPVNFMDPSGMFNVWHWYMNGMGGFSYWVDDNLMGGSTANFGNVTGKYDSGCASGWQVAGAGAWFGANLAMNAIPGGGEAHAAEVVGEDGLRDAAEDLGKGCLLKCFVAGTPVQMADGSVRPISQVQVGDQVRSRNPDTGKDEAKTVTATIERHAPVIVSVALHDAKTGQSETLTCTPEHPFFVPGSGWVEAGSLGIGTSIVTRAGPQMAVASVTWQKNKAEELASAGGLGGYTVYNLTVDGDHTFFVGTTGGGTWVHNVDCIPKRGHGNSKEYRDAVNRLQQSGKENKDWVADGEQQARQFAEDGGLKEDPVTYGDHADGTYQAHPAEPNSGQAEPYNNMDHLKYSYGGGNKGHIWYP